MPNLENLKKQAKLILRQHREGHYPVAAQIRARLSRFQNMSDFEILAAGFRLSDAQELVAKEQGFESWQALRSGIPQGPQPVKASPSKVTIVRAEPQLFVADIEQSCRFFCEQLGFSLVFSYGKPPYYAQVARDAAYINLRRVERAAMEAAIREEEELIAASLTVATAEEIKKLFLEFQSVDVRFDQKLKKQAWGARNFIVRDPDGNQLLFAGPAE